VLVAAAILGFGFLGACLRHVVSTAVTLRTGWAFPAGIFIVNLSGSFALGLLTGLAVTRAWPDWLTMGLGVGAIGAYTTYSTWANDSVNLWRDGLRAAFVVNMVVSVALGVAAAAAGIAIGSRW
jgi:fluoride exporter